MPVFILVAFFGVWCIVVLQVYVRFLFWSFVGVGAVRIFFRCVRVVGDDFCLVCLYS